MTSNLSPDSYTARRLEHATPSHLHLTSRRTFIGPIPDGWLKSHRKSWYRSYLPVGGRSGSSSHKPSFTAAAAAPSVDGEDGEEAVETVLEPRPVSEREGLAVPASTGGAPRLSSQSADPSSTTSLLHSRRGGSVAAEPEQSIQKRTTTARVRFDDVSRLQIRARASRLAARGLGRNSKMKDGELMKMDKMLVRIDITQQSLGEEFDERLSQGVEAKTMDKWREFMIVCRKQSEDDTVGVLQLYKTRVIAANMEEQDKMKKRPKAEIILSPHRARVNLYSALDKTLCIWTRENSRTTIYYLRASSGAVAVEWFTFLTSLLGWRRPETLQISVPDLSVTLRIDDPFSTPEAAQIMSDAAAGDDTALMKAASHEAGVAKAIIARCVDMLRFSPEWADVMKTWSEGNVMGLAWKRYDRLEWVHGAVEQKMYGTSAMQRTHDLQLRPKDHYPLKTKCRGETEPIQEPSPVEGFLIRLTSQQGHDRRLGKMLFKRLYFTTQDHFLLFLRPSDAKPPPPPKMQPKANGNIPSSDEIAKSVPLKLDIDPYPLQDDHVSWLGHNAVPPKELTQLDEAASTEAQRNTDMMLAADGFIDLCDIAKVRKMRKGATPADQNIDNGDAVDFDIQIDPTDSLTDDGSTTEVDEDRTFELLMKNDLVIRLQAYNKSAAQLWMSRLYALVTYWSARAKADMDLYKSVRAQNLAVLNIDERTEATVGSFAYKWEVQQSYASSTLYNMCGITSCRTIHLSGLLFRKPRRHTTFTRCHVILASGHLLIYQDTLRKRSGKKLVHIHHERIAAIDLQGCYIYSGLLTENDLLYQNRTFDSNTPGHNALPRVYLEDGWTSTDEDAMTTFVIWHSKSKAWFKSSHFVDDVKASQKSAAKDAKSGLEGKFETKLKRVSQLGATGRSVVFKARSRAERDHWVLGIGNEIEKLSGREAEVRVVQAGKS
ncbi:hypothetical protein B0A48_15987 [Cryoendolithus antarcticus]|uniref:PH domain-containing protein n=1 Tax=Cryoendolithus antarcticus TaxID=1507870 RepID=A0A1V8SGA2_9PEZI|nr:hypothetical protein B0A48_15987 [Cryoendolithus antarcticus]